MPLLGNNELTLLITAKDGASDILKKVNKNVGDLGSEASGSGRALELLGTGVSKIASVAKTAFLAASTAATGFGIVAAKASWDQVSAVEQATVALRAYEKDGSKVNAVLSQLIAYARSDMGVLFNRKDLFAAAQGLKMMGDSTDQLNNHVQIMSRSVGLGLSTWEDLTQIIGRVGSTSQLTGDDFDNLTKAGFKLDPKLRNTKITFDELFKVLDKGIPVDALAGQANTIQGLGIRFQTAFRGIGDAILGVDSDTSKFIEGGLGDRLTKALASATQVLKNLKPIVSDSVKNILASFDLLMTGEYRGGMFAGGIEEDSKYVDVLLNIREVAQNTIGSLVLLASGDFKRGLFAPAIEEDSKLVGTILDIRNAAIGAFNFLIPAFQGLANAVTQKVFPALKRLYDEVIVPLAPVVGAGLVGAIYVLVTALSVLASALGVVIDTGTNLFIFFTETLPTGIGVAFKTIGDGVVWLVNHFYEIIGFLIGFLGTLPIKIPVFFIEAFIAIFNWLKNINWFAVFYNIGLAFLQTMDTVKNVALNAWNFVKSINWGDILVGIGKGIANGIIGLIEGAINGALAGLPGNPKVKLNRFARGTNYAPGGLALVGEEGPELINLPRGSQVKTATQTRQVLSQAGSGQAPINITQHIYNQMDYDKSFAELGFQLRAAR